MHFPVSFKNESFCQCTQQRCTKKLCPPKVELPPKECTIQVRVKAPDPPLSTFSRLHPSFPSLLLPHFSAAEPKGTMSYRTWGEFPSIRINKQTNKRISIPSHPPPKGPASPQSSSAPGPKPPQGPKPSPLPLLQGPSLSLSHPASGTIPSQ